MSSWDTGLSSSALEAALAFATADNHDRLWVLLHRHLAPYGITAVIYGAQAMPKPGRELPSLLNSINPLWLDEKLSDGRFERCAYVRASRRRTLPFLWTDLSVIEALSPESRESLTLDIDYQIVAGVTIPMRFSGGLGISSAGLHAAGMAAAEFDHIWSEHGQGITAIIHAFDIALRRRHMEDLSPLSVAERECLLWQSSGLHHKQIAHRLNLTPRQVADRLEAVRTKLKAATASQAMSTAVLLGMIKP